MSLAGHKQDWEDLARTDPLWAILSDPKQKNGKWDLNEFFLTGKQEIDGVMEHVSKMGYLTKRDRVLDFGCGVGRLTRALATYFRECYGVDVSETMVAKAAELNRDTPNCKFVVNTEPHMRVFSDNDFDMVYTSLVLQHVPSTTIIKSYISEFVRIMTSGGLLVFQLPSHIPPVGKLQPRRRLYRLLKTLGFSANFLHARLGLYPIRYNVIPEAEVVAFLRSLGARVLEIQSAPVPRWTIESTTSRSRIARCLALSSAAPRTRQDETETTG